VLLDYQVQQEVQDLRGLKGQGVILVQEELLVVLGCQESLVSQVQLVRMALLVHPVQLVLLGLLDHQVRLVNLANKDQWASVVHLALLAPLDLLAVRDSLALKALLEHLEAKAGQVCSLYYFLLLTLTVYN